MFFVHTTDVRSQRDCQVFFGQETGSRGAVYSCIRTSQLTYFSIHTVLYVLYVRNHMYGSILYIHYRSISLILGKCLFAWPKQNCLWGFKCNRGYNISVQMSIVTGIYYAICPSTRMSIFSGNIHVLNSTMFSFGSITFSLLSLIKLFF